MFFFFFSLFFLLNLIIFLSLFVTIRTQTNKNETNFHHSLTRLSAPLSVELFVILVEYFYNSVFWNEPSVGTAVFCFSKNSLKATILRAPLSYFVNLPSVVVGYDDVSSIHRQRQTVSISFHHRLKGCGGGDKSDTSHPSHHNILLKYNRVGYP